MRSLRTVPLFEPVTAMLKNEWERERALDPSLVGECGAGIQKV